ncbi:unnamed protein product [Vitrella brassicaformis CCMP3155]|uniref:Tubby C-terminal domain-containing protein n=2 Tax=Vitrella brassicaformis TaxID=1169539 RepID=A0A0G4EAH7_VITBC|nr:unnamed protein product [Vitrella brassicaformis CCMP3155]|eukprot:CEL92258.1 unnamed protein product [Vitrella brassicaformis CCMP3155]
MHTRFALHGGCSLQAVESVLTHDAPHCAGSDECDDDERSELGGEGEVAVGDDARAHAASQFSIDDKGEGEGERDNGRRPSRTYASEDAAVMEARRRSLAEKMKHSGITDVFDPTPIERAPSCPFETAVRTATDLRPLLLNPPAKGGMVECQIVREKGGLNKLFPKYTLQTEKGIFLMRSQKRKHNKTSNYWVWMGYEDPTKDSPNFLGKLRANFIGSEYTLFGDGDGSPSSRSASFSSSQSASARTALSGVSASNVLSGGTDQNIQQQLQLQQQEQTSHLWGRRPRGPRQMQVVIPMVHTSNERWVCRPANHEEEGLLSYLKVGDTTHVLTFQNKQPKWNEHIGAFVLNFNKRVTQASVKNFQLVANDDRKRDTHTL